MPKSQLKESKEFYRQFVEWYADIRDFSNDLSLKQAFLKKALQGELENHFKSSGSTAIEDFKDYLNKKHGYNIYHKKQGLESNNTITKESTKDSAKSKNENKGFER